MKAKISEKPFSGKRIVVLRDAAQAQEWGTRLQSLGAEVIYAPMINIKPLKQEIQAIPPALLATYTMIIFTSVNSVKYFLATYSEKKCLKAPHTKIVAIGKKTTECLHMQNIKVDLTPNDYNSEGLLETLPDNLAGEHILIPSAQITRGLLEHELSVRGAKVSKMALYSNEPSLHSSVTIKDGDWILFTSPSIVNSFFSCGIYSGQRIISFAIGPTTKKTLNQYIQNDIWMAKQASLDSLIDIMKEVTL